MVMCESKSLAERAMGWNHLFGRWVVAGSSTPSLGVKDSFSRKFVSGVNF